jgi:hypothetical protein
VTDVEALVTPAVVVFEAFVAIVAWDEVEAVDTAPLPPEPVRGTSDESALEPQAATANKGHAARRTRPEENTRETPIISCLQPPLLVATSIVSRSDR